MSTQCTSPHYQNNETPQVDEDATIIIYADDNTPITADKDPENLEMKVQHGATLITDWFAKEQNGVQWRQNKAYYCIDTGSQS